MLLENKIIIFQKRLAKQTHAYLHLDLSLTSSMLSLESFALTDPGKPGCVASPTAYHMCSWACLVCALEYTGIITTLISKLGDKETE